MKKLLLFVLVCLIIAFSLFIQQESRKDMRIAPYNVVGVSRVENVGSGLFVGGYEMAKLNTVPENYSVYDYVMFEIDTNYKSTLFDFFNIHIVNKYYVYDKIVYDCYSDIIDINLPINIQIVVGDNVKVGIPTIFNGF